jgi:hypothetical protein
MPYLSGSKSAASFSIAAHSSDPRRLLLCDGFAVVELDLDVASATLSGLLRRLMTDMRPAHHALHVQRLMMDRHSATSQAPIDPQQRQKIREVFDMFDADHSGTRHHHI